MRSVRPLAFASLALLLCACNPHAPTPLSSAAPAHRGRGPWLHITGNGTSRQPVRFVATTRANRMEYDLVARSFESNGAQGTSVATFSNVHVTFYGRGGKLVSDAAQAVVDEVANTITLHGSVHAKSSSGTTLDCDTLRYDRVLATLHGQGHVVMTNARGMRASGNSVDSDVTLTKVRMT